jgi:hypothetical protein
MMLDPLEGRVRLDEAEDMLGIDAEQKEMLKQVALLKVIRARLEITDAEVETQYENDLKHQLKETINALGGLIRGGSEDDS